MKSKDKKQLHTKTIDELKNAVKTAKEEMFKLGLEHIQKKLKNTQSLFHLRKDLAIMQTILREKEIAQ